MEDTRVVKPVMGATNPFVKPVTRVTKSVTRVTKPSKGGREREFLIDNLLVRVHHIA